MSWYDYAACQGEDPELFFPVGSSGPALFQLRDAKQVCASCPVQSLCLEWALLARIDHGVWGGWSEDERRALRRRSVSRTRVSMDHPMSVSREPATAPAPPA